MSKVFESLVNGSLIDPVGGNNLTLTAGSTGFVQTDKGLALSNESHWASLDSALTFQPGMSLSFNVMFRTINTYNSLFGSNHAHDGYLRLRNGDPTNGFDYENDNGDNVSFNHNEGLTPNIWYNFTFIWSSDNTLDFYLNAGSKHSSGTITGELSIERIMAGYDGPDLVGYMNNFSAYDTEITTKERNELYANFLASSQIGQPKRGFSLDKPKDLSDEVGLVAGYNMTLDEDGTGADLVGNALDITFSGGFLPTDNGIRFHGVDGKGVVGNVGNTKSMSFRIKLDSTTEKILEGAANDKLIHASSGTMTYPEFDNAFIDGIDSNAITAGQWTNVVIVSSTNVDMSAVTIALNNATYGDFEMADLRFYSTQLTLANAIDLHNSFILPTLVETFDEGASGVAKLPQDWIAGTGTYKISQVNQSDTLPTFPGGIKLYDKYLECTVAGTSGTLSYQGTGTYSWDMFKGGDGNTTTFNFINSLVGAGNRYSIDINSDESVSLEKDGSNLFVTAASYTSINTWYHFDVTVTKAGIRTALMDGIEIVEATGSNPVTDTDYMTSIFTSIDFDAGDRVANFNYKDEIEQ